MNKIVIFLILTFWAIILPLSLKGQEGFSAPKSKRTRINFFSIGYNFQTVPQDVHFIKWLKDSLGYQRTITPTQPSFKMQFSGGEKFLVGGSMYFAPLRWGYGASLGYHFNLNKKILIVLQNYIFRNVSLLKAPAYYKVLYPDVRNPKSIRNISLDIQPSMQIILKPSNGRSCTFSIEVGITQSIFKSVWRYGFTEIQIGSNTDGWFPYTKYLGIDVPNIPKTGNFGYFVGAHLSIPFEI